MQKFPRKLIFVQIELNEKNFTSRMYYSEYTIVREIFGVKNFHPLVLTVKNFSLVLCDEN